MKATPEACRRRCRVASCTSPPPGALAACVLPTSSTSSTGSLSVTVGCGKAVAARLAGVTPSLHPSASSSDASKWTTIWKETSRTPSALTLTGTSRPPVAPTWNCSPSFAPRSTPRKPACRLAATVARPVTHGAQRVVALITTARWWLFSSISSPSSPGSTAVGASLL